jgi:hypothetical protein
MQNQILSRSPTKGPIDIAAFELVPPLPEAPAMKSLSSLLLNRFDRSWQKKNMVIKKHLKKHD